MNRALVAFAVVLLAGCLNEKAMIQKLAPKDDDEFARNFIDLIRQGRYDEADPMLNSSVAAQIGANGLSELHKIVDHGQLISVELVGAYVGFLRPWDKANSKRESDLTYQLQFSDGWAVVSVRVESSSMGRHIMGANFQPLSDSLQVLNRFTFKGKSKIYYLFFAACVLVPLFIITTIIICFRSRVRKRWLWIIFIAVAVTQFQLNWSTGEHAFQLTSISLLGASFFRVGLYAPIVFSFGIPVGAILFLVARPWLRRKDEPPPLLTGPGAPLSS